MDERTVRRQRLEQLLELAQAYQGCSRKELARLLGRDRTKLVPSSGIPKLDLVVDLARVLDWQIADVTAFLCPGGAVVSSTNGKSNGNGTHVEDYEQLQLAARDAQRQGRHQA